MPYLTNLAKKMCKIINDQKKINLLKKSAYFDRKYYLSTYKDIAQSGIPPEEHYYYYGWKEGRNPNSIFKSQGYLEIDINQDIKAAGLCPLTHFMEHGKFEHRPMAPNLDFVVYKDVKVLTCNKTTPVSTLKVCALFHLDLKSSIGKALPYIKNIPTWVDIYIATDTDEKITQIIECLQKGNVQNKFEIVKIQNYGRDTEIETLLIGFNEIVRKYDLFSFFHFNFFEQVSYADSWMTFLFNNLLGSRQGIEEIINSFESNKNLGLVCPPIYPVFLNTDQWDANNCKITLEKLLKEKLNYNYDVTIGDQFPVGGMFWARTSAVKDIFDMRLKHDSFLGSERIDDSLKHCIERIWSIVAEKNSYITQEILMPHNSITVHKKGALLKQRIAVYQCVQLNENDLNTCRELLKIAKKVIIVVNSDVKNDTQDIEKYCTVLFRKNIGMDFGAWRDTINFIGYNELNRYDELILLNDSCYFPTFNIEGMFADMEDIDCDFWGNTIHPPINSFPEHIQSYFYCIKNNVFMSETFRFFFSISVDNLSYDNLQKLIVEYEGKFTQKLAQAGFKYSSHQIKLPFSPHMIYRHPLAALILGGRFIKKKSFGHIQGYEIMFIDFVKKMTDLDITDHMFANVPEIKSDIFKVVPQLTCRPAVKQPPGKVEGQPKSTREYFRILLSQAKSVLEIGPLTAHPFNTGKNVQYFDVRGVRKLSEKAKLTKTKSPPLGLDFVSQSSDLENVQEKFVVAFSINILDFQPDIITHINDVFSLLNNNSSYYLIFSDAGSFLDRFWPLSTLADIFRAFPLKSESCFIEADGGKNKPSIPNDLVRHLAHEHRLPHITWGKQKYGNKACDGSFLYIIKSLYYLGYIDCLPVYYAPKQPSSNEFGCILKKPVPQGTSVAYNVSAHLEKSIIHENCTLENGVFVSQPGCVPMFHILSPFVKNSSALGLNLDIKPELETSLKIYYSTDRFSFSDDQVFSFPLRQGAQTVKINIPLEILPDLFYLRIVPVAGPINFTLL